MPLQCDMEHVVQAGQSRPIKSDIDRQVVKGPHRRHLETLTLIPLWLLVMAGLLWHKQRNLLSWAC